MIDRTMGASLTISPLKRRALRRLGLIAIPRILVVCEDVDGKEALLCLLSKWAMEFSDIVDVQVMLGGASELVRLQRLFPTDSRVCRLQVVLDGDKRGLYGATPGLLFLSGELDPVASARSVVRNDANFFAAQLGVTAIEAVLAIMATDYLDHHDFCSGFSEQLRLQGIDTKRVRLSLFRAWAEDEAQLASGKVLVDALLSLASVEIYAH